MQQVVRAKQCKAVDYCHCRRCWHVSCSMQLSTTNTCYRSSHACHITAFRLSITKSQFRLLSSTGSTWELMKHEEIKMNADVKLRVNLEKRRYLCFWKYRIKIVRPHYTLHAGPPGIPVRKAKNSPPATTQNSRWSHNVL